MNEYYPPDFDPTKLPSLRSIPGQGRDKILEIRTMLPWNIRCNTCGHYMHRGTKVSNICNFTRPLCLFQVQCQSCLLYTSDAADE